MRRTNDHAPIGAVETHTVVHATGGEVLIADADALFKGTYLRVGTDLFIIGPDGATTVVVGYFTFETPPDLVHGAARLTGAVVERLAGPDNPGDYVSHPA